MPKAGVDSQIEMLDAGEEFDRSFTRNGKPLAILPSFAPSPGSPVRSALAASTNENIKKAVKRQSEIAPSPKKEEHMSSKEFEDLKDQIADLKKRLDAKSSKDGDEPEPKMSKADAIKTLRAVLEDDDATPAQKNIAKDALALLGAEEDDETKAQARYIDSCMGTAKAATGIRRVGASLELGVMSEQQAQDWLRSRGASR